MEAITKKTISIEFQGKKYALSDDSTIEDLLIHLGLPKDNPKGYKNSSPIHFAGETKGRVLEVHGTSDDNVHLQNTVQMIKKWADLGVEFDLQLYPGQDHSISGAAARIHLFHRILDHFACWLMRPAIN